MSKYLLGGALAAAMVAMAPALAQVPTQTPKPAPVVPQVQNHLGEPGWQGSGRTSVHTRAEVAAHIQTMFAKLDSNRDGSITKAESEAAKGERHKRIEKRVERHGGGKSKAADRRGMFDRIDTNRDGTISRSEFEAAPARHERRIVTADGGPGMNNMRGMRMGMGGLHGRMFDMSDANHDGRVTLQEATNAALRHFDTADVNRDGRLTPEERMQMHQRMRAERRPG